MQADFRADKIRHFFTKYVHSFFVVRLNRQAAEDIEIFGVKIKKGQDCTDCPLALQFMPEYWPDPKKFDPERYYKYRN